MKLWRQLDVQSLAVQLENWIIVDQYVGSYVLFEHKQVYT